MYIVHIVCTISLTRWLSSCEFQITEFHSCNSVRATNVSIAELFRFCSIFFSKSSQFQRNKAKQQWRHRMRTLISKTECAGNKTIGNGISNAVNICRMKWKSSLLMRTAKTEKNRQQNNGLERAQNLQNYESHDTSKNLNCKRIMLHDVYSMACFWPWCFFDSIPICTHTCLGVKLSKSTAREIFYWKQSVRMVRNFVMILHCLTWIMLLSLSLLSFILLFFVYVCLLIERAARWL